MNVYFILPMLSLGEETVNNTSGIHFFSYRSAFLFFGFILIFNLIFNYVMNALGVGYNHALYIGNMFAISGSLTFILSVVEGKIKGKKQCYTLFFSLLFLSAIAGYFIVYK